MSKSSKHDRRAEAFCENIRRLRAERGWTLREMESMCDVSNGHLSLLEQGKANPSLITALHICDALGVSIIEMMEVAS